MADEKMVKVKVAKKCYRDGKVLEAGMTCEVEESIAKKTEWMTPVSGKGDK